VKGVARSRNRYKKEVERSSCMSEMGMQTDEEECRDGRRKRKGKSTRQKVVKVSVYT
jgi:hypothetical protein